MWSNVFDRLGLQSGEKFLVHGGSSGIGTTAIQLAKVFGAEVFTTVGSEEKAQAVRELGADYVINYRETDFVKEIGNITSKEGIDVILDMSVVITLRKTGLLRLLKVVSARLQRFTGLRKISTLAG